MGNRLTFALRDLLFPPRCVGCGELLAPFSGPDAIFCPLCRTAWESAVNEAAEQAERDASRGLIYLTFYRSNRTDGVPERMIYRIKHKGDPRIFAFVAERLSPRVLRAAESLPTRADATGNAGEFPILVTYPPRRSAAVREDGFDQAKRLAQALAKTFGGEFASVIRRSNRRGREQKELDAEGREQNANRSYKMKKSAATTVNGRIVVICDDVCTTGATLNRCAELLVEAGARLVILAAVERTCGREEASDSGG